MAKRPNAIKVTLFFPLFDEDGNPFDRETWRWWQRDMKKLDLDFSELGLAGGAWRGQKDRCRWIMTVIRKETLPEIREFLREARKRFGQTVMYLDYHPVFFELVK